MKLLLLFLLLSYYSSIFSQNYDQKLFPHDPHQGAFFGGFVNLNKDFLFVSSYKDSEKNSATGAIYIFENEENIFTEKSKVFPEDGIAEEYFGYSINSYRNWLISGAHHDSDYGASSGAAYILHNEAGKWKFQQKLTPSDLTEADEFGKKVDIYNDFAISCAYLNDDKGINSGVVYVFKLENNTWNLDTKIYPSDPLDHSQFGLSIDIYKNQIIVGAPFRNDCNGDCGAAYIFERNNGTWIETAKLSPEDLENRDQFGLVVKIKDDFAFVSNLKDDDKGEDCGAVYIYEKIDNDWELQQKLIPDDGERYDGFGYDLDFNDSIVAIGSYFDDDKGENSGSIYLYQKNNNNWEFLRKLTPDDGEESDAFGSSIFLNKKKLIVGAYTDSDMGFLSGSAYVFSLDKIISSNVELLGENTFRVYPTIFNNFINIDNKSINNSINIYDLQGERLFHNENSSLKIKINTSNWKKGIHFVKINNKTKVKVIKLVKY